LNPALDSSNSGFSRPYCRYSFSPRPVVQELGVQGCKRNPKTFDLSKMWKFGPQQNWAKMLGFFWQY